MKKLLLSFLLAVLGIGMASAAEVVLYEENFGTPSANTEISTDYDGFSNSLTKSIITIEGTWKVGTGNNNNNAYPSTGSAGGNLWTTGKNATITFDFGNRFATYSKINLSFLYMKSSGNSKDNNVECFVSVDGGTNWGSNIIANTGKVQWYEYTGEIANPANLKIKFVNISTNSQTARIDDLKITADDSENPGGGNDPDPNVPVTVAAPAFSLASGIVEEGTEVTLTADKDVYVASATDLGAEEPTAENVFLYGTKTNTITVNSTETYYAVAKDAEGNYSSVVSATYTVVKAEDGIFDCSYPQLYGADLEFSTDGTHYEAAATTWTAGDVTMVVSGKYRMWNNGKDLRLYVADNTYSVGTLTFTVPTGCAITSIHFTKSSANKSAVKLTSENGAFDNETLVFTPNAASNTAILTTNGGTSNIAKIVVNYAPYVKVGATGYATLYYSDRALTVPAGIAGWTFLADNTDVKGEDTYTAGSVIPAGEAVVLYTETPGDYVFTVAETTGTPANYNCLKGTDAAESVDFTGKQYILASGTQGIGFYKAAPATATSFTNGAHKAYLEVPATAANAPAFILNLGDTTGAKIITVDAEATESATYNVLGQKVGNNYKGFVVKNGQKTINK